MLTEFLQIGFLISIFAGAVRMGTIILFGALGELITERSGVLNLSVEGMMLSGALAGFLAAYFTDSLWLGVLCAALAGMLISVIFGLAGSGVPDRPDGERPIRQYFRRRADLLSFTAPCSRTSAPKTSPTWCHSPS